MQLGITPKALANFSPGLELATTLGTRNKNGMNPEKGSPTAEPFQGFVLFTLRNPGFSLRFEPWAETSQRLRR
jgi:hypothetical protein